MPALSITREQIDALLGVPVEQTPGNRGTASCFARGRRYTLRLSKITSGLAQMGRSGTLVVGMLDLLKLLSGLLIGVFGSHAAREAETAFLRQQLVVLKRSAPARLRLRTADRLIFVWLYRLCPSVGEAAVVVKPETLAGSAIISAQSSRRPCTVIWRRAGQGQFIITDFKPGLIARPLRSSSLSQTRPD